MISVEEAKTIVLQNIIAAKAMEVDIMESLGKILAEPVRTDRDAPPFDRVTMDGIALHSSGLSKKNTFPIEGIQAAGQSQKTLQDPDNCLEVMTGAVLPKNTDSVIPYELCEVKDGIAKLTSDTSQVFQNIHSQGRDAKKGDVLLNKGEIIRPAAIGILATVGKHKVKVLEFPKIVICSTGDELVDIEQVPAIHQIRKSNTYMLAAALKELGISADTFHVSDDKAIMLMELKKLMENYPVLLFSGAVSKGKYDFLPEVLTELGIQKKVHGVAQKPGKPFLFGTNQSNTVFGFPGNPGSTFICFHTYFIPWLHQYLGLKNIAQYAKLSKDIQFDKALAYHLLIKLELNREGCWIAHPVSNSGSGDLVHLAEADGVMTLPANKDIFRKGEVYPVCLFRNALFKSLSDQL